MDVCAHRKMPGKWKNIFWQLVQALLTQKTGVLAEMFPDSANKIYTDYTSDFMATILFTVSCLTPVLTLEEFKAFAL